MRLATIVEGNATSVALVDGERAYPLDPGLTLLDIIRGGGRIPGRLPDPGWPLSSVTLGPAVPHPGAIYTVGHNYRADGEPADAGPDRPLIFGKAANAVAGHGATLAWDRSLTPNVDAECELGVVIGSDGGVFGYTIVNDVSSRDPWLDGDQWLLGKSMPGFCPVGPWLVTADVLDPVDLGIGCSIDQEPIQDGRTSQMRFSIAEVIAYLGRHVRLDPGDLIVTGTPARLPSPPGPDRHLAPGDVVTCWIEGIGELTTHIG